MGMAGMATLPAFANSNNASQLLGTCWFAFANKSGR